MRKRCVLSLDLKVATEEAVRIEGEREFHRRGAETEKDRVPILVLVRGRNRAMEVDDRVEIE